MPLLPESHRAACAAEVFTPEHFTMTGTAPKPARPATRRNANNASGAPDEAPFANAMLLRGPFSTPWHQEFDKMPPNVPPASRHQAQPSDQPSWRLGVESNLAFYGRIRLSLGPIADLRPSFAAQTEIDCRSTLRAANKVGTQVSGQGENALSPDGSRWRNQRPIAVARRHD